MPDKPIQTMCEVTTHDFINFIKFHAKVVFSDRLGKKELSILIGLPHHLKSLQPKSFTLEAFTTWSFPRRGSWATHKGNYRGNWAPEIPPFLGALNPPLPPVDGTSTHKSHYKYPL